MSSEIGAESRQFPGIPARAARNVQPCGPHYESHLVLFQHFNDVLYLLWPGVIAANNKGPFGWVS
jgi:hypothetical protein